MRSPCNSVYTNFTDDITPRCAGVWGRCDNKLFLVLSCNHLLMNPMLSSDHYTTEQYSRVAHPAKQCQLAHEYCSLVGRSLSRGVIMQMGGCLRSSFMGCTSHYTHTHTHTHNTGHIIRSHDIIPQEAVSIKGQSVTIATVTSFSLLPHCQHKSH